MTLPPISAAELAQRSGLRADLAWQLRPSALQLNYKAVALFIRAHTGVDLSVELRDGVDLLYRGPRTPVFVGNHRSASVHAESVAAKLTALVAEGFLVGPSRGRPLLHRTLVVSPLGAIPKGAADIRLIWDLTASGVNAWTSAPKFKYQALDELLHDLTPVTYLYKVDVSAAYMRIAVRPEDFWLLGAWFAGNYYVSTRLSFGASSAPFLFCRIADALRDAIAARWAVDAPSVKVRSFLDDGFGWGPQLAEVRAMFAAHCATLLTAGLPAASSADKLVSPCQVLVLLGVCIDAVNGTVSLPEDRRARWFPVLSEWMHAAAGVTLATLSRLIGKLGWVARIQPVARPFLRPFRDLFVHLARGAGGGERKTPSLVAALPRECAFFQQLMRRGSWGRRMLYAREGEQRLVLAVDAALSTGLGGAAGSDGAWRRWEMGVYLARGDVSDINELECLCLLLSAVQWLRGKSGCHLHLLCDNAATVGWLRRMAVPGRPFLNTLLQDVALLAAESSSTIYCSHIPGTRNRLADAISRGRQVLPEFWRELLAWGRELPDLAGAARF